MNDRKQEPVAWITKGGKGDLWWHRSVDENGNDNLDDVPLYMAPPVREWVGLTNKDIHKAVIETGIHVFEGDIYAFVQRLQDVLQEKNNG